MFAVVLNDRKWKGLPASVVPAGGVVYNVKNLL